MIRRLLVLLLLLGVLPGFAQSATTYLEPEQAFRARAERAPDGRVLISWEIARDYKLYRHGFEARAASRVGPLTLELPEGRRDFDTVLAREVTYYENTVQAVVRFASPVEPFDLAVSWQGCTIGFCYNPQTAYLRILPGASGALGFAETVELEPDGPLATPSSATTSGIEAILAGGSLLSVATAFLVFGLLLSLTPCVLPMIPVLSAIIVGQAGGGATTRSRGFLLALFYSLGMALVYTAMGIAAGLAGEGLGAFLQQPWVLALFAALLAAMALSMFDVFELQMPSALQSFFNRQTSRFQGGRYLHVFMMGALSSLIIGPCVAAPLAGALLYISQSRDVLTGGVALGTMACGMSVPLLVTGLSAGSLLPRAGAWMIQVKHVFGVMLLAVALWMLNPVLSGSVKLLAWGGLLVFAAFLTPLFNARGSGESFWRVLSRAAGALLLTVGLAEVIGGLMGNTDPLEPIRPLAASSAPATRPGLRFERVATLAELDRVLAEPGKPVMLDFYADWCVSCIEMERFTFNDPTVMTRLSGARLIQVDVTRNSIEDRAIMRRYAVFGPPAMFFFDGSGREIREARLVGFLPADRFDTHLRRAFPSL